MEQFADLLLNSDEIEEAREVVTLLEDEDDSSGFVTWLRARLLAADGEPGQALDMLDNIEVISDALGMKQRDAVLLGSRVRAAVAAGRLEEAIANLLPMMTTHGVVRGHGALLLKLWGTRPTEKLAEFLLDGEGKHAQAIADEIGAVNAQGQQVAQMMQELCAHGVPAPR